MSEARWKTDDGVRRELLCSLQNNMFFDSVIASWAFVLLTTAIKRYPELNKPEDYDQTEFNELGSVTTGDFGIITVLVPGNWTLSGIVAYPGDVITALAKSIQEIQEECDQAWKVIQGTMRLGITNDSVRGLIRLELVYAIKENA